MSKVPVFAERDRIVKDYKAIVEDKQILEVVNNHLITVSDKPAERPTINLHRIEISADGQITTPIVNTIPNPSTNIFAATKQNNVLFIGNEISEEKYLYDIVTVNNTNSTLTRSKVSKAYTFGRAFPTSSTQLFTEWSRIMLGEKESPIPYIKVDQWDHANQTGQFVCAFQPLDEEVIITVALTSDLSKLVVGSMYKGSRIVTIRKVEANKSADTLLEDWQFGGQQQLFGVEVYSSHTIIKTSTQIIVYNNGDGSKWSVDFNQPIAPNTIPLVKLYGLDHNNNNNNNEKSVLVYHSIDDNGLFVTFYDLINKTHLKTIRLSGTVPFSHMDVYNNNTVVLSRANAIHVVEFLGLQAPQ